MSFRAEFGRTLGIVCLALSAFPPVASASERASPGSPADRGEKDAYVLSRRGRWVSTSESLEAVRRVARRFRGDFLWLRRGGKERLLRDPEILDLAEAAFAPLREIEPARAELAGRQGRLEAEESSLDAEQEEIERDADSSGDEEVERGGQSGLAARRRDVEDRMRDLQERERSLDAEERELDRREDALERAAEARLWRVIDRAIAEGKAESLDPER
jgi:hypothetical protein